MSLEVGMPVKFKLKRGYARSRNNEKFDEHSGRIRSLNNGCAIIEGTSITGIYTRTVSDILRDNPLLNFLEES